MDKRKQIIEAAIRLFAEKGYHVTTIQDIASSIGMAKGSLYSYFNSKEDLLISIFKHYYEQLMQRSSAISNDTALSAKERVAKQIEILFEEFHQSKDLLLIQMKEQAFNNRQGITEFISRIKAETDEWFVNNMKALFGDAVESCIYDCAAFLEGLVHTYMRRVVFEGLELKRTELSIYIVERLEDLVGGMLKRKPMPEPMLTPVIMEGARVPFNICFKASHGQVMQEIASALQALHQMERSGTFNTDSLRELISSMRVFEDEMKNDKPRAIIVKGMLALLVNEDIPETYRLRESIERLLHS